MIHTSLISSSLSSASKKFKNFLRVVIAASFVAALPAAVSAQNSMPAPGSGGSFQPAAPGGFAPGPPPMGSPNWGSPWYNGWNSQPTIVMSPSVSIGNSLNQGITKVIACGYDARGIWRVLPLTVSYQYNGAQYSVNVLNAWNPWTDSWVRGIDQQAFNTVFYLRNVQYDYYTVLPFGTFYFNL